MVTTAIFIKLPMVTTAIFITIQEQLNVSVQRRIDREMSVFYFATVALHDCSCNGQKNSAMFYFVND
jgi:hypothetical protein